MRVFLINNVLKILYPQKCRFHFLFFSSWMTWSCHGLLEALEWHLITHSILINLFIKVRLNTLLLPPLLSITFVPSAFYAYVWNILEGTSKAYFFPPTHQL